MALSMQLFKLTPNVLQGISLLRRCSTSSKQIQLTVPTFCDLDVNLPCSVNVKPLNVHTYHNWDKLIIDVVGTDKEVVDYTVNGNNISIFGMEGATFKNIICYVKAPLKANLKVSSSNNISTGHFNGDKLELHSVNGNITVDKFEGDSVNLTTNNGDIVFKGSVQASNIIAKILEKGSILTKKLQGINLFLQTNQGDISCGASYAHESHFETKIGNMNLKNAHQTCKIILGEGNLNLSGFDGALEAILNKGNADIQLARITGESKITGKEIAVLNLKLSDCCEDNTFKIKANECDIAEDVDLLPITRNDSLLLSPTKPLRGHSTVIVECPKGCVNVSKSSWEDQFKIHLK